MRLTTLLVATSLFAALAVSAHGHEAAPHKSAAGGAIPKRVNGPVLRGDGLTLKRIVEVDATTSITSPPRDRRRVFFTQQDGSVYVIRDGRVLRRPFLDISRKVLSTGGEEGLLGLAFHPRYHRNRLFYVYFSDKRQDARLMEFKRAKRNPNRARSRGRTVLRIRHRDFLNHWGGQLAFGPDRLLYVSTGDGGSGTSVPSGGNDPFGNGQNLGSLLAKVLRIDPRRRGKRRYRVPARNPFVGQPGARPEVYSWGLRNPWRFAFDRATGDLAIADVGGDLEEEINFSPSPRRGKGANFGWCNFEGNRSDQICAQGKAAEVPGYLPPALTLAHDEGYCAVIGGHVVRDRRLASLRGRYLYTDFCRGELRTAKLSASGASDDRELGVAVSLPSTFGEDSRGRLYVASRNRGIYRIGPRR